MTDAENKYHHLSGTLSFVTGNIPVRMTKVKNITQLASRPLSESFTRSNDISGLWRAFQLFASI